MNMHFYQCEICGKIIAVMSVDEIPTECCGQTMEEVIPQNTDIAAEKHVPVFHTDNGCVKVCVGSVPHPMEESHSILWIGLFTDCGCQIKSLSPEDPAEACFRIGPEEKVQAVYAFCNIHGLWYSDRESELPADCCGE